MKKSHFIITFIALIIGIGAGYFIFSSTDKNSLKDKTYSQDEKIEWTCTKHRQILEEEFGECQICGLELIPVKPINKNLLSHEFSFSEKEIDQSRIQTTIVGQLKTDERLDIKLKGKITLNNQMQSTQASYFDGRLEKLIADFEGKKIREGDLIAYIYSPELIELQQELKSAADLKLLKPELYDSIYNILKSWKLSDRQIRRLKENNDPVKRFPIYANVSGNISEVLVSEGDYLKQGELILKLKNLNSIWAEFNIDEIKKSIFKEGQKMKITTSTYPEGFFKGEISDVNFNRFSENTNDMIHVRLPNEDRKLKPGMLVEASFFNELQPDSEHLHIPSSAVLKTANNSVVYLKTKAKTPTFLMKEVTFGSNQAGVYEVLNGVKRGDELVTHGLNYLDSLVSLQNNKLPKN